MHHIFFTKQYQLDRGNPESRKVENGTRYICTKSERLISHLEFKIFWSLWLIIYCKHSYLFNFRAKLQSGADGDGAHRQQKNQTDNRSLIN
jgi:hypothetical protein